MICRQISYFCAYIIVTLVFSLAPPTTVAAGAGRAFPIDSENFAIENFKQVNPSIEWDPTNFLVDLSGIYANCNNLNRKGDTLQSDKKNPDGSAITVVIDTIPGAGSDVDSVNGYLRDVIRNWRAGGQFNWHITNAKRVGCSVRPGCSGIVVVACLFSSTSQPPQYTPPWERPTPAIFRRQSTTLWIKDLPQPNPESPRALAFTPEQYKLTEDILRQRWDRAHFLENLSGFETDCNMVNSKDWPFRHMNRISKDHNMKIIGQYGSAVNRGSTPDALSEILKTFKPVRNAQSIGCSVIPDCRTSFNTMYVVVSCLNQEN